MNRAKLAAELYSQTKSQSDNSTNRSVEHILELVFTDTATHVDPDSMYIHCLDAIAITFCFFVEFSHLRLMIIADMNNNTTHKGTVSDNTNRSQHFLPKNIVRANTTVVKKIYVTNAQIENKIWCSVCLSQ